MVDLRTFHGSADLYFVRHGESEGNRAGLMQGRTPSRLTEAGRAQARAAGEWFRERGLGLVLTSPLARASQTADIICAAAGLPGPELVEDLTEIDTGVFSGLSMQEARARYPEDWVEFQAKSWDGVPGAERSSDLSARAERIWAELAARSARGASAVLCVTHSGTIQWVVSTSFGGRAWMPLLPAAENCCVSHLRITNGAPDGRPPSHMARWLMINAIVDGRAGDR